MDRCVWFLGRGLNGCVCEWQKGSVVDIQLFGRINELVGGRRMHEDYGVSFFSGYTIKHNLQTVKSRIVNFRTFISRAVNIWINSFIIRDLISSAGWCGKAGDGAGMPWNAAE